MDWHLVDSLALVVKQFSGLDTGERVDFAFTHCPLVIGLALLAFPAVPEGQRPEPMVPGPHHGRSRSHAKNPDRGPCAKAAHRLVALRGNRGGAAGCRPAPGRVTPLLGVS